MPLVIVTNHSLFITGVINWLQTCRPQIPLHVIDGQQPEAMAELISLRPDIVIQEIIERCPSPSLPLYPLLRSLPEVTLILLDSQQQYVQRIRSERGQVRGAEDFLTFIENAIAGRKQ